MSTSVNRDAGPGKGIAEAVISGVLTVVFVAGLVTALGWPIEAAIFPIGVNALGTLLAGTYFIKSLLQQRKKVSPDISLANLGDDDEDGDDDLEYVFSSASRRDWARSLAFLGGFFLALYVVGLYIAAALFCFFYLRYEAKTSWKAASIYAFVLVAILYGVFGLALKLPVPAGLFPPLGG